MQQVNKRWQFSTPIAKNDPAFFWCFVDVEYYLCSCLKMPFLASFSLFSSLQQWKVNMFIIKFCQWLDSNCVSLLWQLSHNHCTSYHQFLSMNLSSGYRITLNAPFANAIWVFIYYCFAFWSLCLITFGWLYFKNLYLLMGIGPRIARIRQPVAIWPPRGQYLGMT